MHHIFPEMIDRPDTSKTIPAVIYSIVCFFSMPFLLLIFMTGNQDNYPVLAWAEIAYHCLNFVVSLLLFREFLADSLINAQLNKKRFFLVCGSCCAVVLIYAVSNFISFWDKPDRFAVLSAYMTLPLSEMDILITPTTVVSAQPIFGILCMTVLTPVTVSCLYYSTSFCPGCCRNPWLGYLLVCVMLALPKIANGLTWWDPVEEMIIYLIQLPIHLIACWSYQKTDCVWAPITILGVSNFIYSILYMIPVLLFQ